MGEIAHGALACPPPHGLDSGGGDRRRDFRLPLDKEVVARADRELPLGWRAAGKEGLKPEVLAWIEEVWTTCARGLRDRMQGLKSDD